MIWNNSILFSECPRSPDHMERFACPRPDRRGRFRCIDDRALCDGFYDCPDKEDENPDHCLFYKTVRILTESFFWTIEQLDRWLSSFLVMKIVQENYCSWMIFPMLFCELNCNSGTNFCFCRLRHISTSWQRPCYDGRGAAKRLSSEIASSLPTTNELFPKVFQTY